MHAQMRHAVGSQRLGRHARTEIGAADADIDDVGNRFPGGTAPFARVDGIAEAAHLVEYRAHIGHDVVAGDHDRTAGVANVTQGHVQHGTVLRCG